MNEFYLQIDQRNFLLNNIVLYNDDEIIKGKNVLSLYAGKFKTIRKQYDSSIHDFDFFDDHWHDFTKEIFKKMDYQVIHYFEFVIFIIDSIVQSRSLSMQEKDYFIDKFKYYITIEERLILMWLGTFESGIYDICNKHSLLHGIYNKNLENIGLDFYDRTAFGGSTKWKKVFDNNS